MNKKPIINEDELQKMMMEGRAEFVTVKQILDEPQPIAEVKTEIISEEKPIMQTTKKKEIEETTENSNTVAVVPVSRKQAKEEYAKKFLKKEAVPLRRNIAVSESVYQKLLHVHGVCLHRQVQLTAFVGHIIEDHIETHKDVIKDISKDTIVNL